jgi:hypothetical protein
MFPEGARKGALGATWALGRRWVSCMVVRILLCTAASLCAAPVAAGAAGLPAAAKLVSCSVEDRTAVFDGDVRQARGSSRVQVRLTLQARTVGRWAKVKAPGFGTWNTSATGVRRYVYTKRVQALLGPAAYRVKIDFRWLSGSGRVIERAQKLSPVCRMPDPRADLVLDGLLSAVALSEENWRYSLPVRNAGLEDAETFAVGLVVNGVLRPRSDVAMLLAGERTVVTFDAPRCLPGSEVEVELDITDAIPESDERNVARVACPA